MKFKTNIEKKVIFQDQEIEVIFVKDDDGIVKCIDFVGYCDDCEELHLLKRYVPLTDDDLANELMMEYINSKENDYDEEEENINDIISNIFRDK